MAKTAPWVRAPACRGVTKRRPLDSLDELGTSFARDKLAALRLRSGQAALHTRRTKGLGRQQFGG
jgi:hypothetical protein